MEILSTLNWEKLDLFSQQIDNIFRSQSAGEVHFHHFVSVHVYLIPSQQRSDDRQWTVVQCFLSMLSAATSSREALAVARTEQFNCHFFKQSIRIISHRAWNKGYTNFAKILQSRRRPLLRSSPGWKRLLAFKTLYVCMYFILSYQQIKYYMLVRARITCVTVH